VTGQRPEHSGGDEILAGQASRDSSASTGWADPSKLRSGADPDRVQSIEHRRQPKSERQIGNRGKGEDPAE
jgi:hypothetical protein